MPKKVDTSSLIQNEIDKAVALEHSLATQVAQIKAAQEQINSSWEQVKDVMIANNVKSIKGDFGSITVAERTTFKTDMTKLPDEFKKLAPDTAKIGSHYALLGDVPEGAEPVVTRYLTKRLK